MDEATFRENLKRENYAEPVNFMLRKPDLKASMRW